jgi:F420H(2)-dependent quinone reductase
MAYLKPPAFTRHLANPLEMRVSARGVVTLTVVGRRTGQPRKVPVIPVEIGRNRYLVCRTASPTGCAISELPAPAS